jgi:hypothetical protein
VTAGPLSIAMLIRGSCHCGNITLQLEWTPEPTEIPARACNCSFCTKHGGVWTSCPTGALTVTIADPVQVSSYAFGTKTAEFHVCARCGVVPVVTSAIDGTTYAVVNVNSLEGLDKALLKHASASFEGESELLRSARRKRNWIARVHFSKSTG